MGARGPRVGAVGDPVGEVMLHDVPIDAVGAGLRQINALGVVSVDRVVLDPVPLGLIEEDPAAPVVLDGIVVDIESALKYFQQFRYLLVR